MKKANIDDVENSKRTIKKFRTSKKLKREKNGMGSKDTKK